MSIAPPNARRKTGVQRISSGSSARPMRSRSRQNASIRAFSARQKSSRSSAAGCSAAMASRTPRTSAGSSSAASRSRAPCRPQLAREPDHLGAHGLVFALGAGQDPFRRQCRRSASCGASSRRTARRRGGPRPRSPGRTTSRRWRLRSASSAARAVAAAAVEPRRQRGDGRIAVARRPRPRRARRRSARRCRAVARAPSRSGTARPAVLVPTSAAFARVANDRAVASSRAGDADVSRSASGANSRARSVNRPSPAR